MYFVTTIKKQRAPLLVKRQMLYFIIHLCKFFEVIPFARRIFLSLLNTKKGAREIVNGSSGQGLGNKGYAPVERRVKMANVRTYISRFIVWLAFGLWKIRLRPVLPRFGSCFSVFQNFISERNGVGRKIALNNRFI